MGGVADVVTHPAHRGKGYGAKMLRAAVERMREERYPVSILWGITDFYHRFGYAPVLPNYTLVAMTRNVERLVAEGIGGGSLTAAEVEVRPGRAEDAPALLALYERANAERNGTLRRTAEKLDPTPSPQVENWWQHPRRTLVAVEEGKPAGFVLLHGNPAQLRVLETTVPGEHAETAGLALLGALAREAVERRVGEIELPVPPDEPLAQLLRRGGAEAKVRYPANGGGMGRITHLGALGEAIRETLAARAESLPGVQRPSAIELVCVAEGDEPEERATVSLGSDGGETVTLRLPQQQLCQLLMGYRGIDDVRRQHPDACAKEVVTVLRALLPEGYPHMWSIDHF